LRRSSGIPGKTAGKTDFVDSAAAVLMLVAGLFHASGHAIVKTGSSLSVLAGMGLVSAVLAFPFLFMVPAPSIEVWPILLLSLGLHAAYKVSLALTYEKSELSRAYPLARGLVPLFAIGLSYLLLSQLPKPVQLAGIAVIICGVIGLSIEPKRSGLHVRTLLAAAVASVMVAGYSVVDALGTRSASGWSSFTAWLIVLDSLSFFAVARAIRGPQIWMEVRRARATTITAGILGVSSFAILLWALSRNPVASVVAFRECSVLFAALIGVLLLKERVSGKNLLSIALVAIGLIVVATSK
jgi:drug/metabolite transporter (DMT)-like permease